MNTETEQRIETELETDPRVDLAVERTELALERTHLAWIRTTLTFITAGLAIDAASSLIHQQRLLHNIALVRNGHLIGIFLTTSGLLLLVVETLYYLKRSKQLSMIKKGKLKWFIPGLALSLIVFVLGLFLVVMMFFTDESQRM